MAHFSFKERLELAERLALVTAFSPDFIGGLIDAYDLDEEQVRVVLAEASQRAVAPYLVAEKMLEARAALRRASSDTAPPSPPVRSPSRR